MSNRLLLDHDEWVTPGDPGGITRGSLVTVVTVDTSESLPPAGGVGIARASIATASFPCTKSTPDATTSTVSGRGFACNRPVTRATAPGRRPRSVRSIDASPPRRSSSVLPAMSCSSVPAGSDSS